MHLAIHSPQDSIKKYKCRFYNSFEQALSEWQLGTRISPLFTCSDKFHIGEKPSGSLLFLGPIQPGSIDLLIAINTRVSVLLSLGYFNLVLFSKVASDMAGILKEVKKAGGEAAAFEEWELKGGEIVSVRSSIRKPTVGKVISSIVPRPASLRSSTQEYLSLMASAITWRRQHAPNLAKDLEIYDASLRKILSNKDLSASEKQTYLVNSNAILSRQTSQSHAGTSPILCRESHYWSHSLLGIGTATLALENVTRFVSSVVLSSELIARFETFESHKPLEKSPLSIPIDSELWQVDYLASVSPAKIKKDSSGRQPILTCFSGRDGFRSKHSSLTAPLEIIGAANTISWTPLTITHEICHILIAAVLASISTAGTTSKQGLSSKLLERAFAPTSLLEQLRQVVAVLMASIWSSETGEKSISDEEFAYTVKVNWDELNEISTHCLDFLYFYRRNDVLYTRSIWSSWDVIPDIDHRISGYVFRNLCAIHCLNVNRADGRSVSIHRLRELLTEINTSNPAGQYISNALDYIKAEEKALEQRLLNWSGVIRLVRYFLYSDSIASKFTTDKMLAGNADGRDGYPFRWNEFSTDRVSNPLRFIEVFSQDRDADQARSCWLLQQIAFMNASSGDADPHIKKGKKK